MRSLIFRGLLLNGHNTFSSGFFCRLGPALAAMGVRLGTQKLGSSFARPPATLEILSGWLSLPALGDLLKGSLGLLTMASSRLAKLSTCACFSALARSANS